MVPGDRPRWSILVATLAHREEKLLRLLTEALLPQALGASAPVEVVVLRNYGEKTISEYRQAMLDDARGEYVSFVDDDDWVFPDYAGDVIAAIDAGADVVGFEVECVGMPGRRTLLSTEYWEAPWEAVQVDGQLTYLRYPTHLCPVRTELARHAGFSGQLTYSEDRQYSFALRSWLEEAKEVFIPKALYRYIFNLGDTSFQYGASDYPLVAQAIQMRRDRRRPAPQIMYPCFRWHPWSML